MMKVATVAAAIALVAPSMPSARCVTYARLIAAEAAREHVDPILVVALVEHESRWRKGAHSHDGEDYGLGQIRARFLPECRVLVSRRCLATKRRLLTDAASNLRRTVRILGDWRRACRTTESMVAGYAGGRCKPLPRAGREILEAWATLRVRLHLPAP